MSEEFPPLTGKQRSHLRSIAHNLKAILQVGKGGLTPAFLDQIRQGLEHHELIKIKVGKNSPIGLDEFAAAIEETLQCHVAQKIGKTLLLYLAHPEKPVIKLPK